MHLYIIRHAEAGERDPEAWPDDDLRPITPYGESMLRRLVRSCGGLPDWVDIFAHSPLARARQTARVLRELTAWRPPEEWPELRPDAPVDALLARIRATGATHLAIVGHNPQVERLVGQVLTGAERGLRLRFEKGAIVCLALREGIGLGGELRWMAAPSPARD